MHVRELSDPATFLRVAEPLLMRDEARHNLLLGLAYTLRDEPAVYPEHHLWIVESGEEVVGAALQTPPHSLVLACPSEPAAIDALADAIDHDLPGVGGVQLDAERFAAGWTARTGQSPKIRFRQGLYRLARSSRIDRSPGAMRWAASDDEPLARAWWREFAIEAMHQNDPDEEEVARAVAHRVARRSLALWQTGEEIVALAGLQGQTAHGVRVGPVYTPLEYRGRGYATSLVADLSESALAAGNHFCVLYTDLANPTSNRIYERIGYELLCESAEITFGSIAS